MSNFDAFHSQLFSVTEMIAKAAVDEINRRVGDSCAIFRLEIFQSQREIESLKHKLQVLEREFMCTRQKKRERITERELSCRPGKGEELTDVEEFRNELEVDLCYTVHDSTSAGAEPVTQPTAVKAEKKPDTDPTPVGDPEELREQHRCGHGDEELSGLELVVKAEQEEEHVAQRLSQTGCELSAGRLSTLDSECVVYDKDTQLLTSLTQGNNNIECYDPDYSNATEQCSRGQAVHSPRLHTPATMEVSGSTLPSLEASCAEGFYKMDEKPSVCSKELRSEAIHTQEGQYKERLRHTMERRNQTLLPQQQQHGPSVQHRRGSESPAQPHSGSQNGSGSGLKTGAINAGKKRQTRQRSCFRERPFSCTQCEKSFNFISLLKIHQRSHTGEKPYSCTDCGKGFSQLGNLITHQRLHTGEKPFCCPHCGMRFTQQSGLTAHQGIHTGEKPFACSQCGKCFSRPSNLSTHRKRHCRN